MEQEEASPSMSSATSTVAMGDNLTTINAGDALSSPWAIGALVVLAVLGIVAILKA